MTEEELAAMQGHAENVDSRMSENVDSRMSEDCLRLIAEVRRLWAINAERDGDAWMLARLLAQNVRFSDENTRLRAALEKYARHPWGCPRYMHTGECTCGLDEALKGDASTLKTDDPADTPTAG